MSQKACNVKKDKLKNLISYFPMGFVFGSNNRENDLFKKCS